jgi:elongation factor P--beta-lysine ligase
LLLALKNGAKRAKYLRQIKIENAMKDLTKSNRQKGIISNSQQQQQQQQRQQQPIPKSVTTKKSAKK